LKSKNFIFNKKKKKKKTKEPYFFNGCFTKPMVNNRCDATNNIMILMDDE